jgi:hypothetical protein
VFWIKAHLYSGRRVKLSAPIDHHERPTIAYRLPCRLNGQANRTSSYPMSQPLNQRTEEEPPLRKQSIKRRAIAGNDGIIPFRVIIRLHLRNSRLQLLDLRVRPKTGTGARILCPVPTAGTERRVPAPLSR